MRINRRRTVCDDDSKREIGSVCLPKRQSFSRNDTRAARLGVRGYEEGQFGDLALRSQENNMRGSCKVLGLFCVVLTVLASFGQAQTVDVPQRNGRLPAVRATEPPAYPLVIRIDHTALELLATTKVDERGRVDDVVLGTHAVGESHTQGSISGLLVPDRDDA